MANIELVIKISEKYFNDIKECVKDGGIDHEPWLAIANGILIPRGHGKLVDLDQMRDDYWDGNYMEIHKDDLKNIKTIIEADIESKE